MSHECNTRENVQKYLMSLLYMQTKELHYLYNCPMEKDKKHYYLVNKDWLNELKNSFNYKNIVSNSDIANNNENYFEFKNNLSNLLNINEGQINNKIETISNSDNYLCTKERIEISEKDIYYPKTGELIKQEFFSNSPGWTGNNNPLYEILIGYNSIIIIDNEMKNTLFICSLVNDSNIDSYNFNIQIDGILIYNDEGDDEDIFERELKKIRDFKGIDNYYNKRKLNAEKKGQQTIIDLEGEEIGFYFNINEKCYRYSGDVSMNLLKQNIFKKKEDEKIPKNMEDIKEETLSNSKSEMSDIYSKKSSSNNPSNIETPSDKNNPYNLNDSSSNSAFQKNICAHSGTVKTNLHLANSNILSNCNQPNEGQKLSTSNNINQNQKNDNLDYAKQINKDFIPNPLSDTNLRNINTNDYVGGNNNINKYNNTPGYSNNSNNIENNNIINCNNTQGIFNNKNNVGNASININYNEINKMNDFSNINPANKFRFINNNLINNNINNLNQNYFNENINQVQGMNNNILVNNYSQNIPINNINNNMVMNSNMNNLNYMNNKNNNNNNQIFNQKSSSFNNYTINNIDEILNNPNFYSTYSEKISNMNRNELKVQNNIMNNQININNMNNINNNMNKGMNIFNNNMNLNNNPNNMNNCNNDINNVNDGSIMNNQNCILSNNMNSSNMMINNMNNSNMMLNNMNNSNMMINNMNNSNMMINNMNNNNMILNNMNNNNMIPNSMNNMNNNIMNLNNMNNSNMISNNLMNNNMLPNGINNNNMTPNNNINNTNNNKKNNSTKIKLTQSISYENDSGYICNNLTEYLKKLK